MENAINYIFVLQAVLCAVPAFAASEQVGGLPSRCDEVSGQLDRMIEQLHQSLKKQREGIAYLNKILFHPAASYYATGTLGSLWERLTARRTDFSSQFRKGLALQTELYDKGFFGGEKMQVFLTAGDIVYCLSSDQIADLIERSGKFHAELGALLDNATELLRQGAGADFGEVLRVMNNAVKKQRAFLDFLEEIKTLLWFTSEEE